MLPFFGLGCLSSCCAWTRMFEDVAGFFSLSSSTFIAVAVFLLYDDPFVRTLSFLAILGAFSLLNPPSHSSFTFTSLGPRSFVRLRCPYFD